VQNAAVVIKIAVILLFIGFAPAPMPSLGETAGPFPFASFGVSLAWISFSYSGWNAAVYIGGEVRDPERNLPRALLIGTLLVTSLYLALNAVFVFAAPVDQLAGRLDVARIAGEHLGGPVLANARWWRWSS
jgi:APA family basic amino acid/polyamine antiporter